ncbi:MAG: hypothetical protein HZA31_08240 [Opitutae bacterium]|nr:hypothetical protein [Opitutae bacterium]
MDILGLILGMAFIGLALWAMISTLIHIQRDVGIVSPTGLPWTVLVIVSNLAGVILYRWFREPIEERAKKLFRHGLQ